MGSPIKSLGLAKSGETSVVKLENKTGESFVRQEYVAGRQLAFVSGRVLNRVAVCGVIRHVAILQGDLVDVQVRYYSRTWSQEHVVVGVECHLPFVRCIQIYHAKC